MPTWIGHERLIQRGAQITEEPKPPWWKPLERMRWRERCVTAALLTLVRLPKYEIKKCETCGGDGIAFVKHPHDTGYSRVCKPCRGSGIRQPQRIWRERNETR